MKKCTFVLLFVCFATIGFSQNRFQIGTLPTINLNKKLKNNWHLNFKSEFRQLFAAGVFGEDNTSNYEYVHTDAAFVISKKVGLNNKLAGGFLLRFKDKSIIKRTIQQFTIINPFNSFRLGHRFASDQTFENQNPLALRLRYRITFDIPLNGQNTDANEWYLKFSNEYLNRFQSTNYDLEVRLLPTLGYVFTDHNKLEVGLDYRINDFVNQDTRQRFWLAINWYISL